MRNKAVLADITRPSAFPTFIALPILFCDTGWGRAKTESFLPRQFGDSMKILISQMLHQLSKSLVVKIGCFFKLSLDK